MPRIIESRGHPGAHRRKKRPARNSWDAPTDRCCGSRGRTLHLILGSMAVETHSQVWKPFEPVDGDEPLSAGNGVQNAEIVRSERRSPSQVPGRYADNRRVAASVARKVVCSQCRIPILLVRVKTRLCPRLIDQPDPFLVASILGEGSGTFFNLCMRRGE